MEDVIISFDIGIRNLAYCIMQYNGIQHNKYEILSWNVIDLMDLKSNFKCQINNCKTNALYKYENKYLCKNHSKLCENNSKLCENNSKLCENNSKLCENNSKLCENNLTRIYTINNVSYCELAKIACEKLDSIDFSNINYVLIESQPLKGTAYVKCLSYFICDYFLMKYYMKKDKKLKDVIYINAKNKLKVYDGPYIECNLKKQYDRNKFYGKEYCKYILQHDKKNLDFFNSFKKKDDLADCYLQGVWYINNIKSISTTVKNISPKIEDNTKIKIKIKLKIKLKTNDNNIIYYNNLNKYKYICAYNPSNNKISYKYTLSNIKYIFEKLYNSNNYKTEADFNEIIEYCNKNKYLINSINFNFGSINFIIKYYMSK